MSELRLPFNARVRGAAVLVLILGTFSFAAAQSIDEYVNKQMAERHIPGLAVAVVRDGQVVVAKGYGRANVELDVPATENTVFQLASVTKQFTATAIMLLVEEGKLGLEDKVSARLSDLPAAWSGVTIRQLLTHTSGIKNYTATKDFNKRARNDISRAEILQLVAEAPLDFPSGSKHNYSNTGYFLLGLLIEKASGKTYQEFLRDRIFQPLGMSSTRLNDIHDLVKHRAAGYMWKNNTWQNAIFVSPTQPFSAGALISTGADMGRWEAALNSSKLLPSKAWEVMWSPAQLTDGSASNYGFGWGIEQKKGRRLISHGGGIEGFSTFTTRVPEAKISVTILTNLEGSHAQRIAQGILGIYVPDLAPPVLVPIADTAPDSTAKLRDFLVRAAAGNVDRDEFTTEGQAFFFPERIKQFPGILGSFGALKTFELVEDDTKDGVRRRRYRYSGENRKALIAFMLDANGKIAGIGISAE